MNAYIVFIQNGSRHIYDHSTTSATSSVQLGGKANLFDYLFFSQRKEVWFNGIRNKSNFYIINIGVRTVNYNIHTSCALLLMLDESKGHLEWLVLTEYFNNGTTYR